MRIDWPDIQYTALIEPGEYTTKFKIYPWFGTYTNGKIAFGGVDAPVFDDPSDANPSIEGNISWDGCVNWDNADDDCMEHACCRTDVEYYMLALLRACAVAFNATRKKDRGIW